MRSGEKRERGEQEGYFLVRRRRPVVRVVSGEEEGLL